MELFCHNNEYCNNGPKLLIKKYSAYNFCEHCYVFAVTGDLIVDSGLYKYFVGDVSLPVTRKICCSVNLSNDKYLIFKDRIFTEANLRMRTLEDSKKIVFVTENINFDPLYVRIIKLKCANSSYCKRMYTGPELKLLPFEQIYYCEHCYAYAKDKTVIPGSAIELYLSDRFSPSFYY